MKTLPDDASNDQSGNIPTGYYRRNTGMLNMLPESTAIPPQKGLTDDQLQDKGFLRDLAIKELAAIIQANKGDVRGVNACSVLLDRVEGKPQQSLEVTGKIGIIEIVMEAAKLRQMPTIENGSNIND